MKTKQLKELTYVLPLMALPLQAQNERPNIILINIDDLGWTDLACNGSKYYETPNVDQLKANGIWFQEAYAGAANSAPSRACMLTGMNTPRHGMFTVGTSARGGKPGKTKRRLIPIKNKGILDAGIQMLPQVLHDAGYQTAHIGKWHVTEDPTQNGMDYNIAGCHAGSPGSYFAPYAKKIEHLTQGPDGEYLTYRLANEMEKYLRNVDKSKPFFLYYATYAIHEPLQPTPELLAKYEGKTGDQAHNNPKYGAMVESMDQTIGQLMKTLKELHLEENTMIVFTGDNGGVWGTSKQWPLRAGKGCYYEGGIRIPMIIYQKGKFEKGNIDQVYVSQMDLFPTFLDAAHISTEGLLLDGKSLIPVMEGKDNHIGERALYWNFPGYLEGGHAESHDPFWRSTPQAAIRKGDWKLIKFYEWGEVELYNLKEDISEKNNLAKVFPDKAKELLTDLEQWQKETNAPIATELDPLYVVPTGIQNSQKEKGIRISSKKKKIRVDSSADIESILLYNAEGSLVAESNATEVNLGNYPAGTYIVKVKAQGTEKTEKIVLE